MQIHEHVLGFLSLVFILSCQVTSSPMQSSASISFGVNGNLPVQDLPLPRLLDHVKATSRPTAPFLLNSTKLFHFIDWSVSDTLSLRIEVGEWRLSAARIVQILDEVQRTVDKKVSSVRLIEKFVVSTGRYLNTMVFEITPDLIDEGLEWADVTEIVGSHGLPIYFQNTEQWRSTFFTILRTHGNSYVEIGKGAVRKKWYQLELPDREIGNRIGREKRKVHDRRSGSSV